MTISCRLAALALVARCATGMAMVVSGSHGSGPTLAPSAPASLGSYARPAVTQQPSDVNDDDLFITGAGPRFDRSEDALMLEELICIGAPPPQYDTLDAGTITADDDEPMNNMRSSMQCFDAFDETLWAQELILR